MQDFIFDGSATMANNLFGERFGVDWEFISPGGGDVVIPREKGKPIVKVGEKVPIHFMDLNCVAEMFKRESGYKNHWSDCSIHNKGVPDMLSPCDCGGANNPGTDN